MVELANRNVFSISPGFAPVKRNVQATVVAIYDVVRIVGANPKCVVIRVNGPSSPSGEGFSTVFAFGNKGINRINPVFIFGIHIYFRVVKWAVSLTLVGHFLPFSAAIGTFIQGIFFGFHECVYDVRIAFCNCQTHAPQFAFRKPILFCSFFPGFTCIVTDVQPGTFATAL